MLAKVISLSTSEKNVGFSPVVSYIFRDDKKLENGDREPIGLVEGGQFNLYADLDSLEDRKLAAELMDGTAAQTERNGRFKGNPAYHYSINWMEGEHPTKEQVEQAVAHSLNALGMHECETIWAIHRDTENDHVHVVVNRVHPEKEIVVGPPRRDYLILDKAMREIEIKQGWQHAPGPWVVVPGRDGTPEIVRMSKAERRKLGLMNDPGQMTESQQARRAEKNSGVPSFQKWLSTDVSPHVREALNRPGAGWEDVHVALARHGCSIEIKGSGMIIKSTLGERTMTAKASHIAYWASQSRLEATLGPFQPPRLQVEADPSRTYSKFVDDIQSGIHDGPGITGKQDPERMATRIDRAKARDELKARYKAEQAATKEIRPQKRHALQEIHAAERKALGEFLKAGKDDFIQQQAKNGIRGPVAYSLWSREKALARESMQIRHRLERRELTTSIPKGLVWRAWLEQQAEKGDEAAKAALRGIRYREQRQKAALQNAIEGEELEPLKPFTKPKLERENEDSYKITLANLTPEIDTRKQIIVYRDEQGQKRFTDEGPRIVVHDTADGSLESALRLAAQKYGGEVKLTGSAEFREEAARTAARLGIMVADEDLKQVHEREQERIKEERQSQFRNPEARKLEVSQERDARIEPKIEHDDRDIER